MILDSLRTSVETILKNATSHANVISILSLERLRNHVAIPSAAQGSVYDGEPVSPAVGALSASLPLPPEAAFRGYVHRWRPHETEALLAVAKSVGMQDKLPIRKAMEALGWASLPDPHGLLYMRVAAKLASLRYRMRHGEEPVADPGAKRLLNKAMTWGAWIRAALAQIGDREFTISEVRAMLEANPDISPLLDRRPDSYRKTRLRWQTILTTRVQMHPGVVRTGVKRGRSMLYRYDPTDPGAVPTKRRRQPKKGVPGLPHLGRHEGSKGDAAAVTAEQQQHI